MIRATEPDTTTACALEHQRRSEKEEPEGPVSFGIRITLRTSPYVVAGGAMGQVFDQHGARPLRDVPVRERGPRATGDDSHLESAVHEQGPEDLPRFGSQHLMPILGGYISQEAVRADHRVPRQPGDVRQRQPILGQAEHGFARGAFVGEAERVRIDHHPLESIGFDDLLQRCLVHSRFSRRAGESLNLEDDSQPCQRVPARSPFQPVRVLASQASGCIRV